jgi:hypothetical protein
MTVWGASRNAPGRRRPFSIQVLLERSRVEPDRSTFVLDLLSVLYTAPGAVAKARRDKIVS